MGRGDALNRLVPLLIGGVMVALFVPPVLAILGAGVGQGDVLGRWAEILLAESTWRTVRFSFLQAAASAAAAVLLALPGAYYLSHLRFPGRRLVHSLSLVPLVLPTLVVVLAVLSFYGRSGLVNQLLGTDARIVYSPVGIIVAHVIFNWAVAMRLVATAWLNVDERFREISLSLGESAPARAWHLHLPIIAPALLNALGIIFLYCFASFGIVLVFGGVRFTTLEVRIYQQMFVQLDLTAAGALATLQLLLSAAVLVVVQQLSGRRPTVTGRSRRFVVREWNDLAPTSRALCLFYWSVVAVCFVAPLGGVVVRAFRPGGEWSLSAFHALFSGQAGDREIAEIIRAGFGTLVATSLGVAAGSAVLTTAVAVGVARALRGHNVPWLDALSGIPLAVSSVTFSLGMWLLYSRYVPPLVLLWLTQLVSSFPLIYRTVRAGVQSTPIRFLETARSLGAGKMFLFLSVELPVITRAVLNALAFSFALSLADFTSVLVIGRGRIVTFPVAMYRLIGFQSFDVALALGVCYMVIVIVVFLIIDRTSHAREEFGL